MKKHIILLLFFCLASISYGQFIQGRLVISPMIGMQDVTKLINKNNLDEEKEYSFEGSYVPVLNVDYGISKLVSVGIGVAYQEITITDESYQYFDPRSGLEVREPLIMDFKRIEPGVRGYLHFIDNSHIDIYSGLKIGYAIWSGPDYTTNDTQVFSHEHLKGKNLNFQTIFGIRGYFARYLGFHIEAGLVAPYQIAAGLNYRIFTKNALKHQPKGRPIKSRDQMWYHLFKRY